MGPRKSFERVSCRTTHRVLRPYAPDTSSKLRGRPASRSSSNLGSKHFRQRRLGFRNGEVRSGFSRREARNKGGTTIGRGCLTLEDRGFMAGRGRVSRCCLPLEARGLESRSTFLGGEGRLRSWDPKVSSASTPDEKAARPLGPRERGREVAGPERPVQTLSARKRVC